MVAICANSIHIFRMHSFPYYIIILLTLLLNALWQWIPYTHAKRYFRFCSNYSNKRTMAVILHRHNSSSYLVGILRFHVWSSYLAVIFACHTWLSYLASFRNYSVIKHNTVYKYTYNAYSCKGIHIYDSIYFISI